VHQLFLVQPVERRQEAERDVDARPPRSVGDAEGVMFLAKLLERQSLAQRLAEGPLPLTERDPSRWS
jgi:hypothetical protein